jgi:hypothetical protein
MCESKYLSWRTWDEGWNREWRWFVPSALKELTSVGNKPSKLATQFDKLRVDVGAI